MSTREHAQQGDRDTLVPGFPRFPTGIRQTLMTPVTMEPLAHAVHEMIETR